MAESLDIFNSEQVINNAATIDAYSGGPTPTFAASIYTELRDAQDTVHLGDALTDLLESLSLQQPGLALQQHFQNAKLRLEN